MAEMTKEQVRNMTDDELITKLRIAAFSERRHEKLTQERSTLLANIVGIYGDALADALIDWWDNTSDEADPINWSAWGNPND